MKKLLAIVLVASFALVGAVNASAVTVEELQAQIATLLQQIAALSGTTTTTTTTTTTATFSTDLSQGMTSNDVKNLQARLGVSQTGYFGPLTLAAVKAYQASKNIPATGYVGPLTRAALNSSATPTSTVPGCAAGALFSATTGASCTGTTTTTTTTTTSTTTEGTLTAVSSPTFVETTLKKGDTQKAILATKLEAKNSDIAIKRMDVEISGTTVQPWKSFSSFELYVNGTLIKGIPAIKENFIENSYAINYTLRFDNMSFTVAKGTTADVVLKTTVPSNPENVTGVYTFKFLQTNSIRGVDTAGIDQYAPATTLASAAFDSSTWTATAGTLTLSLNANSPKLGYIFGNTTATTSDVVLGSIDFKGENRDTTIKTLKVTMTDAATIASAVKLYDGSTLLASVAGANGEITFSNLAILIAKDTTKTLTLKADLKPIAGGLIGGSILGTITANASKVVAVDSNDDVATITAGTIATKALTAYVKAPVITLVSTNIVKTTQAGSSDIADATITFNITATGGDIYLKKAGNLTSDTDNAPAAEGYNYTSTADAFDGNYYIIRSGETKSVTATGHLTGADAFVKMYLKDFKWNITNATGDATEVQVTTSTYDLSTFVTSSIWLETLP